MKDRLLKIRNLSLSNKSAEIIKNISLDIEKGELVVLAGKSGSGKSTLAKGLSGFSGIKTTYDKLEIGGVDLGSLKPYDRHKYIGVAFQNARLSLVNNTLREELIFILENLKVSRSKMDEILLDHVQKFKLHDLLDRDIDSLSGGELQLVAFCAISIIDSSLYVLDEPFSNCDTKSASKLKDYIKNQVSKGKSYLIIDHNIKQWDMADRLMVLKDGCLIADDLDCKRDRNFLIKNGLLLSDEIKIENKKVKTKPLISIKNLSISYEDKEIIRDASFDLEENKLIALIGESGSGKSSIFKSILGQIPYQGDIEFLGKSLKDIKKKDFFKDIGLVFQDPSLQFIKTRVKDELELTGNNDFYNFSKSYKLDTYMDKSPWTLSQGEQRRLAVLIMVLMDKKILLFDEPSYGQDVENSLKIMDDLKRLSKDRTVVFTSHDRDLVDLYSDKIFRIDKKGVICDR